MARAQPLGELPRTVDEFDRWNREQPDRWEVIPGVPVMMAPGSRRHTIINGNIHAEWPAKLAGASCTAYVDGTELRGEDQSAIPDAVVSCRSPDFSTPLEDAPAVIVQVSSRTSFNQDMISKLGRYRLYPTLQRHLVAHFDARCARLPHRETVDGLIQLWQGAGTIDPPAIGVTLTLDEILEAVPVTEPGGAP
jgi:Uma2 family endonuclease